MEEREELLFCGYSAVELFHNERFDAARVVLFTVHLDELGTASFFLVGDDWNNGPNFC